MNDGRKQIRIGELLMESGIVASDYIKNALGSFEQRGLPIGKVLVMSGYLTEQQLRTALEVQSLINDGLIPLGVGINVLAIAHKEKVTLPDAFQNSGFVQPEDQQTNKLGQLLVGANIVTAKDLDEALQTNIRTGLPLGHIFCFRGMVSQSLIWTGLLCQQLVRKGMVSRDMAIQALRDAHDREVALEALPMNKGFQRLAMKPTPKLGDLLTESYIISEHQLDESMHRTLVTRRFLGEVLIAERIVPAHIVDAAIDMQEMIDNNTLSASLAVEALTLMRANGASMVVAVAQVGAYKPRLNKAVKLIELLTMTGALKDVTLPKDAQDCLRVNYNQARQVVKILLDEKIADEQLVYSALRCVYLIDENLLDMEKSIIALDHANRNKVSLDQAMLELGWTVRTRLRFEPITLQPSPAPSQQTTPRS